MFKRFTGLFLILMVLFSVMPNSVALAEDTPALQLPAPLVEYMFNDAPGNIAQNTSTFGSTSGYNSNYNIRMYRGDVPFNNSSDRFLMEAEAAKVTSGSGHEWKIFSETEYAGSQFAMQCTASDGSSDGTVWTAEEIAANASVSPGLSYKLNFTSITIPYSVWAYAKLSDTSGNAGIGAIHAGLDGICSMTNAVAAGPAYSWIKVGSTGVTSAGTHELTVWAGKEGIFIDKIYLVNNAEDTAPGTNASIPGVALSPKFYPPNTANPGDSADLHSVDGMGVSKSAGDFAFDNTASSIMSNAGGMGIAVGDPFNGMAGGLDARYKAMTITGWYKTDSDIAIGKTGTSTYLVTKYDSFAVGARGNGNFFFQAGAASVEADLSREVYKDTKKWVFFAVTFRQTSASNGVVNFYKGTDKTPVVLVNTQNIAAGEIPQGHTGHMLYIGNSALAPKGCNAFDGYMDNIRIYGVNSADTADAAAGELTIEQLEARRILDGGTVASVNPPNLLSAQGGDGEVALTWSAVQNATVYEVVYGTASGTYTQNIPVGNVTSYTVTGLTNNTRYYFAVKAIREEGSSEASNEINAVALPAPARPVLNSAAARYGSVKLGWSSSEWAAGYRIKYGRTGGSAENSIDAGKATAYTVNGLETGAEYYFTVCAYNTTGTSEDSNTMTAVPAKEFTVQASPITNAEGTPITALDPSGNVQAVVTVTNNTNEPKKAVMVIALYDSFNAMANYVFVEKTVEPIDTAGAPEILKGGFKLPSDTAGHRLKIYVLDGMSGVIHKLSDTVTFPESAEIELAVANYEKAPLETYDEVLAAEALEVIAAWQAALEKDPVKKELLLSRIEAKSVKVSEAKSRLLNSISEQAVSAYEAAPVSTLEEIKNAEYLEQTAEAKLADLTDNMLKQALETRIAAKKALVEAAKVAFAGQYIDVSVRAAETGNIEICFSRPVGVDDEFALISDILVKKDGQPVQLNYGAYSSNGNLRISSNNLKSFSKATIYGLVPDSSYTVEFKAQKVCDREGKAPVFGEKAELVAKHPGAAIDVATEIPGNRQVYLSWDKKLVDAVYTVKRSTTSGGPYDIVRSGIKGVVFWDHEISNGGVKLHNGTTYYYKIIGDNPDGSTAESEEIAVTPVLTASDSGQYYEGYDSGKAYLGMSLPASWRPFSDDSPWNAPIGENPELDPNSGTIIDFISKQGKPLEFVTGDWAVPFHVVNTDLLGSNVDLYHWNRPNETVFDPYDLDQDGLTDFKLPLIGPFNRPTGAAPFPSTDTTWQEWTSDGHLVIIDPFKQLAWDFSRFGRNLPVLPADGTEYAQSSTFNVWDLSGTGVGVPYEGEKWWMRGGRAFGGPSFAGVIRPEEVEAGEIRHAIAFSTPWNRKGDDDSQWFVFPATRNDGTNTGEQYLWEGARLQLDPSLTDEDFDEWGLGEDARVIARALQKYGMINTDNSGNFTIFGQNLDPNKQISREMWNEKFPGIRDQIFNIPIDKFRVLEPGTLYMGERK